MAPVGLGGKIGVMDFARHEIEGSLPARFAAVVRRYPDQPALRDAGLAWTYRELDRASDLISRFCPPAPDAPPVLLLLGHGALEIAALLAVLKSGRAWVALDPRSPPELLAEIATDTQSNRILTCRGHASRVAGLGVHVEVLPEATTLLTAARAAEPAPTPATAIGPDSLASIVYTSGSTGTPKGVMRSHRSALHRCWLFQEDQRLAPGERVAHLFSCGFVAAEVDVYGALLNGGTLCCYPARELGFPDFLAWLKAEKIALLHPPTAFWRQLLAGLEAPPDLPALRTVFLAGAALYRRDLERMRATLPGCTVVHRLSSSEASLMAQITIPPGLQITDEVVPAGWPVCDKALLLLDRDGREVTPGEAGEIVVESRYLAPGYWRRPELTATRFMVVPSGCRYLTGDLGRFDSDGRLHHLGRLDDQIKLRGFRIEPGAIETALMAHAAIDGAAVVARTGPAGEQALVAYLQVQPGQALDISRLRAALSRRLPDYMIPNVFVPMASLPLTASGKVDRKSLPEPVAGHAAPAGRLPANAIELKLCSLVAELTGCDKVGLDDDFFTLGGDSLLAMRLVARVEAETGRRLAAAEFMRDPTVAGLLARISGNGSGPRFHAAIEPYRVADAWAGQNALFFAPGYDGHPHDARKLLADLPRDVSVFGITAPMGAAASKDIVADTAAYCVDRVREVQPRGPYRIAGYSFGGKVAHAMACLLEDQGERVELLFLIEPSTNLKAALMGQGDGDRHRVFSGHAVLVRSWEQPMRQLSMPGLGWEHLCAGGVTVYDVPTNHWGLMAPPHARQVASILQSRLLPEVSTSATRGVRETAILHFAPLPQVLDSARALLGLGKPLAAWDLLQTLSPDSLPSWTLDFVQHVAHQSAGAVPKSWDWAQQHAHLGIRLVGPLLRVGRAAEALALLENGCLATPEGVLPESRLLAHVVCACMDNNIELARALLARLEQTFQTAPDRGVGAIYALHGVDWPEVVPRLAQRVLERGSGPARAQVLGLIFLGHLARRNWPEAVKYGTAAIAAHPVVSAHYPNLILALVKLGDLEEARRYHQQAVERFLGWRGYRNRLDSALAGRR
jgi:amino acid adenylation domain-containing protein